MKGLSESGGEARGANVLRLYLCLHASIEGVAAGPSSATDDVGRSSIRARPAGRAALLFLSDTRRVRMCALTIAPKYTWTADTRGLIFSCYRYEPEGAAGVYMRHAPMPPRT